MQVVWFHTWIEIKIHAIKSNAYALRGFGQLNTKELKCIQAIILLRKLCPRKAF